MSIIEDIKAVGDISELLARVTTLASMKFGFHKIKFPSKYPSDEELLTGFGYNNIQSLTNLAKKRSETFLFDAERCSKEFFSVFRGNYVDSIVKDAERVLKHQFRIFEKDVIFDDIINWHWSETGESWPLIHWSKLNIDFGRYGDVKYTWELNKHHSFCVLGRAFLSTKEAKYLKEFEAEVKSWMEQNPPEIGINWVSNQEIAYRSISWMIALNFFAKDMDETLIVNMLKVLIKNARHIYSDIGFTTRCIKNNHIIGDATGLAILSIFLKEWYESEMWYKRAHKVIDGTLDWLFHKDGSYKLLSTNYQRVTLYFLLIYALIAKRHKYDIPDKLWGILKAGIESLVKVAKDGYRLPVIGAWDSAKPIGLLKTASGDLRPLLSTAAVLFKSPIFKSLAGSFSEETYWLLGPDSFREYNSLPGTYKKSTVFSGALDNGICVFKGKGIYLSLIGGKHPVNSQRHSDYLSMEISLNDRDLIIDGGNYRYNTQKEWNHYFRSTFSHNTVLVDEQSQSVPYREFRWLYRGKTKLNKIINNDEYFLLDGEHNGYRRLELIHRRIVLLLKDGALTIVIDRLTGSGRHKLQQIFHFSPLNAIVDSVRGICVLEKDGKTFAKLEPLYTDSSLRTSIINGQLSPIQGWVSYEYGEKIPSPALIYEKVSILPAYFVTLISPISSEINHKLRVVDVKEDFLSIKVENRLCSYVMIYSFKDSLLIKEKHYRRR